MAIMGMMCPETGVLHISTIGFAVADVTLAMVDATEPGVAAMISRTKLLWHLAIVYEADLEQQTWNASTNDQCSLAVKIKICVTLKGPASSSSHIYS
ncbi:hypothetical protein PG990_001835 [Apiospora arundinis]